jgi:serine protease AprX
MRRGKWIAAGSTPARGEMSRKTLLPLVLLVVLAVPALAAAADRPAPADSRLDRELRARAREPRGSSRVILTLQPGASAAATEAAIRKVRGVVGRRLASVGAQVAYVPDGALDALGRLPGVSGVRIDRRVHGTLERTGATIGANWVRDTLGVDGEGVGIAIVDSGVATWHDDLTGGRVARFVDFVNFQSAAYDDYGHGTHVAGIIAGDGHDSEGRRRGIAPGATLLVEKVLDATGQGYISNVIAAIDYAIANKDALRIRVINLSVAAAVQESYLTDPLTLAAKRAVEAGIVVVSAAGNLGKTEQGQPQYGGIGAPGNAPWVITVGASSHNGTADRSDDTIAAFSSRGPSAIDFQAKPDVLAPGVGIESTAEAGSTLWNTKPLMRLWGTVPTATEPYLSLSGTSMAAPVVSGTIALMLEVNPSLTPNLVKAILQYTAEAHADYNALTQGAGFLNARGAVQLAQSLSGTSLIAAAPRPEWSGQVIWGNHRIGGFALRAGAAAWRTDVIWGSGVAVGGAAAVLDAACAGAGCEDDNIVWGTHCGGADCDDIVWGTTAEGDNIVWGTAAEGDNIVWGTASDGERDNIVWGTSAIDAADDVVWGLPAIRRQPRIVPITDGAAA